MKRTKAWRRAQRVRKLSATERKLKNQGWFRPECRYESDEQFKVRIARQTTTPKGCSGPCCGNPRRWFAGQDALTMQERREFQD